MHSFLPEHNIYSKSISDHDSEPYLKVIDADEVRPFGVVLDEACDPGHPLTPSLSHGSLSQV